MKSCKVVFLLMLMLALMVSGGSAYAENAREFSKHIVYFNAFPTDSLPPEMTKQYGLKRSKNYAMINIAVMEKGAGVPTGVRSKVTGSMKNLMAQQSTLEFREIKEGKAIYYIAQVGVQSKQIVNFYIDIKPQGHDEKYTIKFSKQF